LFYRKQKHAENGRVLVLALYETLFTAAWAALAGALFLIFTELWVYSLLPAALLVIHFLVSAELSGEGSMLVALGIEQHRSDGSGMPSQKAVYYRVLLSVVFFLPLLIGYITLLFGKASLPELVTGIRLTEVNRALDPRDPSLIKKVARKAAIRAGTLVIVPMIAAVAMFILLHSTPSTILLQSPGTSTTLSEQDQELLTHYLELTALHPEELEYHVRLASLYHRNNMQQDLINELAVIGEMDSTHAIMLLADTTSFSFNQLEPLSGDSTEYLYANVHVGLLETSSADSTKADSTAVDSLDVQPDSTALAGVADSFAVIRTDTVPEITGSTPETVSDSLSPAPAQEPDSMETASISAAEEPDSTETTSPPPSEEPDSTETATTPPAAETQVTEEEPVEPDTLIQP
jgi:hypothetical protein